MLTKARLLISLGTLGVVGGSGTGIYYGIQEFSKNGDENKEHENSNVSPNLPKGDAGKTKKPGDEVSDVNKGKAGQVGQQKLPPNGDPVIQTDSNLPASPLPQKVVDLTESPVNSQASDNTEVPVVDENVEGTPSVHSETGNLSK